MDASHPNDLAAADIDCIETDGALEVRVGNERHRVSSDELRAYVARGKHPVPRGSVDEMSALVDIGAAFRVNERAMRYLAGEPDCQLFTYFARLDASSDDEFIAFKQTRLLLVGHPRLSELVRSDLMPFFPHVESYPAEQLSALGENAERPTLLIVCTAADDAAMIRSARQVAKLGLDYAPLMFSEQTVTLGPWCRPGHASCLECARSFDGPGKAPADEEFSRSSAVLAWRSTQAHARAWAAGVIASQLEGLRCAAAKVRHWGHQTTMEMALGAQSVRRVWRVPWCAACSDATTLVNRGR